MAAPSPKTATGPSVMLADGSTAVMLMMARVLAGAGIAAELEQVPGDCSQYGAVLVDTAMMAPDGTPLLRLLRQSGTDGLVALRGRSCACSDDDLAGLPVLAKPFTPAGLLATVAGALAAGAHHGRALLDEAELATSWGEQPALLHQVAALFMTEAEDLCAAIAGAAAGQDRAALAAHAHQLKGAASNIGAARLTAVAATAEAVAPIAAPEDAVRLAATLAQTATATRAALHIYLQRAAA